MTSLEETQVALPARRANRPVTLAARAEHAALQGLIALFRLAGVDAASAISGRFCRTAGPLLRTVTKRGETNMRLVYPDWTDAEIRAALRDVWDNLGRTAGEFAHLEKFDPFADDSRIEIVGAERLKAVAEGGGPVIFVSGHFANWELMSVAFHRAGLDYGVANNPLVDEFIIRERAKVMSRRQIPKGKRGARALVDTLKAGRSLAMLVDQKLNDGVDAPFMGLPAMTAPTPARLSLKFGAPLIPVSIERTKGARFRITVREPIEFAPSGDPAADTRALTMLVNEAIERDIRARPGQWLWLHRRWAKDLYREGGS